MASKQQKSASKSGQSVLVNVEKITTSVKTEDIQLLSDMVEAEIGDHRLSQEELEQLQNLMSVDAVEAKKWRTVADVLKYTSLHALAENNPEATKKLAQTALGIVGLFYPAANIAEGLVAKVPDNIFSALTKIGGLASPEYLLYKGINTIANKKLEKAKSHSDSNADENTVNLYIVCKKASIGKEAEKKIGDSIISANPIIWNEAAWNAYRDKLSEKDKVLLIGKIKHTESLTEEQIRFNEFGIKYGWNYNIATILAEPAELKKSSTYQRFLSVLDELQIEEQKKQNAKFKFDWRAAGKLAFLPPLLLVDTFHESNAIREQQLLFGLHKFCENDLNAFLGVQK